MKIVVLIFAVTIFDYTTKYHITQTMNEGMSIPVINGFFHITYVLNAGAAFGILENQRTFFILVALVMLALFMYYFKTIMREPLLAQVAVGLLAAGALGNLIDRARIGKVIDFLDFRIWPVFNVADIAICVGAGVILWETLTRKE